ncbi:MAG: RNA-binding S4 domain-containing protein [Bacteroidales bacterium]|nr:RNA-binding S4 domain-containing protein [Bacteroidales bacterium]
MENSIRIDKYLWAIRIFKTRSLASQACKAGKIKIDGNNIKASREVKIDDIITIQIGQLSKTIKVKNIIKNRVSAKLAIENYEYLTPAEEYEKLKLQKEMNIEYRDRGSGRPTKKERRIITKLKKEKF